MKKLMIKICLLLLIFNVELSSKITIKNTIATIIAASLIGSLSANYYFGKKKYDYFDEKINNLNKQKDSKNLKEIENIKTELDIETKRQKSNKWFGAFNRYFFHNDEFEILKNKLKNMETDENNKINLKENIYKFNNGSLKEKIDIYKDYFLKINNNNNNNNIKLKFYNEIVEQLNVIEVKVITKIQYIENLYINIKDKDFEYEAELNQLKELKNLIKEINELKKENTYLFEKFYNNIYYLNLFKDLNDLNDLNIDNYIVTRERLINKIKKIKQLEEEKDINSLNSNLQYLINDDNDFKTFKIIEQKYLQELLTKISEGFLNIFIQNQQQDQMNKFQNQIQKNIEPVQQQNQQQINNQEFIIAKFQSEEKINIFIEEKINNQNNINILTQYEENFKNKDYFIEKFLKDNKFYINNINEFENFIDSNLKNIRKLIENKKTIIMNEKKGEQLKIDMIKNNKNQVEQQQQQNINSKNSLNNFFSNVNNQNNNFGSEQQQHKKNIIQNQNTENEEEDDIDNFNIFGEKRKKLLKDMDDKKNNNNQNQKEVQQDQQQNQKNDQEEYETSDNPNGYEKEDYSYELENENEQIDKNEKPEKTKMREFGKEIFKYTGINPYRMWEIIAKLMKEPEFNTKNKRDRNAKFFERIKQEVLEKYHLFEDIYTSGIKEELKDILIFNDFFHNDLYKFFTKDKCCHYKDAIKIYREEYKKKMETLASESKLIVNPYDGNRSKEYFQQIFSIDKKIQKNKELAIDKIKKLFYEKDKKEIKFDEDDKEEIIQNNEFKGKEDIDNLKNEYDKKITDLIYLVERFNENEIYLKNNNKKINHDRFENYMRYLSNQIDEIAPDIKNKNNKSNEEFRQYWMDNKDEYEKEEKKNDRIILYKNDLTDEKLNDVFNNNVVVVQNVNLENEKDKIASATDPHDGLEPFILLVEDYLSNKNTKALTISGDLVDRGYFKEQGYLMLIIGSFLNVFAAKYKFPIIIPGGNHENITVIKTESSNQKEGQKTYDSYYKNLFIDNKNNLNDNLSEKERQEKFNLYLKKTFPLMGLLQVLCKKVFMNHIVLKHSAGMDLLENSIDESNGKKIVKVNINKNNLELRKFYIKSGLQKATQWCDPSDSGVSFTRGRGYSDYEHENEFLLKNFINLNKEFIIIKGHTHNDTFEDKNDVKKLQNQVQKCIDGYNIIIDENKFKITNKVHSLLEKKSIFLLPFSSNNKYKYLFLSKNITNCNNENNLKICKYDKNSQQQILYEICSGFELENNKIISKIYAITDNGLNALTPNKIELDQNNNIQQNNFQKQFLLQNNNNFSFQNQKEDKKNNNDNDSENEMDVSRIGGSNKK